MSCLRDLNSQSGKAFLQLSRSVRDVVLYGEYKLRLELVETLLHKKFSLRMCIANHTTNWNDVRETLAATERFGTEALDLP